jgi:hypothetical protein
MAVDPGFSQQRQHLADALECRRGQRISGELDEVRQCQLFADDEYPLAKPLQ